MKSMIKQKPWIRDYLLIFIGTALMSIALKSAFDTNGIVDGGFSGIAIIVKSVTEPLIPGGIPLGVTNLILNIPMFFLGIKIMGFGFMAKTIWGTVSLSFWLTDSVDDHICSDSQHKNRQNRLYSGIRVC